jgi:hypothetical protein
MDLKIEKIIMKKQRKFFHEIKKIQIFIYPLNKTI